MRLGRVAALGCAFLLAGLVSPAAYAAQTRVCLDLDLGPELFDASPRQEITRDYGEDRGRWEGSRPFEAQRWLVRVVDRNTGEPLWGFAPLDDEGCTGSQPHIEYDHPTSFDIQYVHWAHWETGDRSFIGYTCTGMDTSDPNCTFELDLAVTDVDAVASGTTSASIAQEPPDVREVEHALWAMTFCEERITLNPDYELYVGYSAGTFEGTAAALLVGNLPTVMMKGNGWHSKFTACHELGHVQTALLRGITDASAVDYTYNPANPADPRPVQHSWGSGGSSPEWQSAAAIEGFANLYSAWAWSNIDRQGAIPYVSGGATEQSFEALDIPVGECWDDPNFPGAYEDPGAANEGNWATALRQFRLDASSTPATATLFGMLGQAYAQGQASWVASGQNSDFWDNFINQMNGYLSSSQLSDWEDAAEAWCIVQ